MDLFERIRISERKVNFDNLKTIGKIIEALAANSAWTRREKLQLHHLCASIVSMAEEEDEESALMAA